MLFFLESAYPWIKVVENSRSRIRLDNGSKIIFTPHSTVLNAIKGFSHTLILSDLTSFYRKKFFLEFFSAMGSIVNKPKIVLSSTAVGNTPDFMRSVLTKRYKAIEFDVVRLSADDISFFLKSANFQKTTIFVKAYYKNLVFSKSF